MSHILRCTQCGRTAKEIFDCSSRELGHCPFIELNKVKRLLSFTKPKRENNIFNFFILLGVISLNFYLISIWNTLPLRTIWVTILGLLGVVFVITLTLIEKVRLYNSGIGLRLEITRFIGIYLSCKWSSRGKVLSIHFKLNQNFALPLSVVGLAAISRDFGTNFQTDLRVSMEECVTIVKFALIALIINENIEIYQYDNNYSDEIYYFVVGRNNAPAKGNLESELFRIVKLWHNRAIMESWSWTDGPTIYDLVSSVFSQAEGISYPDKWLQTDRGSYKKWLIENIYLNAVNLGLGKIEYPSFFGVPVAQGLIFLKWDKNQVIKVQQSLQVANDLSKQLAMINHDFYQELDRNILIAIESREHKDDN